MFVVSYQSIEEFGDSMIWQSTDDTVIRIAQREYRTPQGSGMAIRHYVVLQARIGDEIHLCKIIGQLYSYRSNEFPDHAAARAKELAWSGRIEKILVDFCESAYFTLRPGYWQVPDIDKIVGFSWPEAE